MNICLHVIFESLMVNVCAPRDLEKFQGQCFLLCVITESLMVSIFALQDNHMQRMLHD